MKSKRTLGTKEIFFAHHLDIAQAGFFSFHNAFLLCCTEPGKVAYALIKGKAPPSDRKDQGSVCLMLVKLRNTVCSVILSTDEWQVSLIYKELTLKPAQIHPVQLGARDVGRS